jgi:UDP-N-acetylmuramyl pentapeptide phosphotransferase/UDP-N-acetylglucosamine-1-phosphate transferase
MPIYLAYTLSFVCALVASLYGVPKVIRVASQKHIFDLPDLERKMHTHKVPNLGGIGIFFSFILVTSLFIAEPLTAKWGYIVASCIVLFLVGVNDDLLSVSPAKKLLAQLVAAFITVYIADIRISSLEGLFGIQEIPYWYSVLFSMLGCAFIMNAINLTDGIDGLAGSFTAVATLLIGICLSDINYEGGAIMAFVLTGAIIGFLRYNIAPAKVFMGDTGSLLIGYVLSVLSILFVNSHIQGHGSHLIYTSRGAVTIALSFLFIAVFDCLRVFIARLAKGISPFKADRNHLHYYLLDAGLSQNKSVLTVLLANLFIVAIAWHMQQMNPNLTVVCMTVAASIIMAIAYIARKRKRTEQKN